MTCRRMGRLAYDRLPTERARQFDFAGTSNQKTYLQDETGNRRFFPIMTRMTALAQAKQFEVLLSAHVALPEDALDHKHNSLIATTAQSVLGNSLKVDETAFQRSESERDRRLEEIRVAIEAYWARQAESEEE
jgi:hypothetical protein